MLKRVPSWGGGSSASVPVSHRERIFGADLARACAILFVFIVHLVGYTFFALGVMPPGYFLVFFGTTGVELFFVLSGYLIGGLLLDIVFASPDLRQWMIFMVRRWMRTVPAYAVWVAVLLLAIPPAAGPLTTALHYLTFTQNLAWPMPLDNWFGVSWSLSVEEWFYLLFSALVLGLARFGGSRSMTIALGVFMLVPLLLRLVFALHVPDWDVGLRKIAVYRLDAIAYGVVLAWVLRSRPGLGKGVEAVLFVVGATIMAGTEYLLLSAPPAMFPWIFSIVPAAIAISLPFVLHLPPPPRAIARVVTWISTRSYAIYLVHTSIMEFMLRHPMGGLRTLVITYILGTGLLAELLHRAVELPLLKIRPRQFAARPVHGGGLAAASVAARAP